MEIIRIIKGMLYDDEFENTTLDKKWLLIPNDSTRYSLVERSGFLKLFHGNPNLMLLLEEPDSEYVFDLRNEYSFKLASKIFNNTTCNSCYHTDEQLKGKDCVNCRYHPLKSGVPCI